jgi:hypothetical protein
MEQHVRHLRDGQTACGSVNAVTRVGGSVVRPTGSWSPAVHALLGHLAAVGFGFAPRLVDVDAASATETLTYIDGDVAMRPWPACLRRTTGIAAVGKMLRAYHAAVASFAPPPGNVWRDPEACWQAGMVVRHGDLGPWNMVWRSGRLVGLIDWDMAEPGYAVDDVAQAAWYCVPLRPKEACEESGIALADRFDRLAALCAAYGARPVAVLEALQHLQARECSRIERHARAGLEPWRTFLGRGDVDVLRAEMSERRGGCGASDSYLLE